MDRAERLSGEAMSELVGRAYVATMLRGHLSPRLRAQVDDALTRGSFDALLRSAETETDNNLVLIAAHLVEVPWVTLLDPRPFLTLLRALPRDMRVDVLAALDAVVASSELAYGYPQT